jgi:hypothetical protein
MIKRIPTLALVLIVLSPAAFALQQKLVVDFRSPRSGAQVPPTTSVGLGAYWAGGISFADYNDGVEPAFMWSPKYGISEQRGSGPKQQEALGPVNPVYAGEDMVITGLPGTGMLIDDIRKTNKLKDDGIDFPFGRNDHTYLDNAFGRENVIITFGPVKNQPVHAVDIDGYGGTYATAGFTKSEPAKHHVPDGGSTLLLLCGGLLGLMTMARLSMQAPLKSLRQLEISV